MSRAIDPLVAQELTKDSVKMCHLLEIHLATSTYLTDAGQDVLHDSRNYLASSHFLNVKAVQESSDVKVGSTKLILSGVDQTFISAFLSGGYVSRQVRILRAFLNDQNAIIGEPVLVYDGRINGYDVKDTPNTSTIEVDLASHWADFEKKSGRVTNSNSQSMYFAGDKGFDFAANVIKDIKWGRG
jgi:hypothetical protein